VEVRVLLLKSVFCVIDTLSLNCLFAATIAEHGGKGMLDQYYQGYVGALISEFVPGVNKYAWAKELPPAYWTKLVTQNRQVAARELASFLQYIGPQRPLEIQQPHVRNDVMIERPNAYHVQKI
jgi:hypothetical protein